MVLVFRVLVSVTVIEVTVYKHTDGDVQPSVFCRPVSRSVWDFVFVWFDLHNSQYPTKTITEAMAPRSCSPFTVDYTSLLFHLFQCCIVIFLSNL